MGGKTGQGIERNPIYLWNLNSTQQIFPEKSTMCEICKMLALPQRLQNYMGEGRTGFTEVHK